MKWSKIDYLIHISQNHLSFYTVSTLISYIVYACMKGYYATEFHASRSVNN